MKLKKKQFNVKEPAKMEDKEEKIQKLRDIWKPFCHGHCLITDSLVVH